MGRDVEPGLERELSRRQADVADVWRLESEIVVVVAGDPIPVPGRGDLTYPFRAHSDYYYLTDRNRPGGVLAFDPGEGWVHFEPVVTESERLWSTTADGQPSGPTTADLQPWLAARSGRPTAVLGSTLPSVDSDADLTERLRLELSGIRRRKDAIELARMRAAFEATRAGFAALQPFLREGVSEREIQIEFEAAAFRAGADATAYDTIVGSGPNSAVLHATPTHRQLRHGELVLIDAGADFLGYASDVTRTYPVGGRFSADQRDVYALVQEAQRAALAHCRPGSEWRDVHRSAAVVIAEGLASLGVLRGTPPSLVESGAVWLFFPHGVGHLVGLGVRDAGGTLPERRADPPPFPNLRIDLPLEPGMVVTVEPGVYFVPALLQDPGRRRIHRGHVDWDRVDRLLGFGGIRIEENALITKTGYEILTDTIPQPEP